MPAKSAKSRKSSVYNILMATEITMKTADELLIMDCYSGLWSADLNEIQTAGDHLVHLKIDRYVVVKYLGSLLGPSTALTVSQSIDSTNKDKYLYYHLPRDGAILRWNFRQPLTAEGHEILHFSRKPIVQILFGAKGSVWIVRERNDQFGDHCTRIFPLGPFNGRLFPWSPSIEKGVQIRVFQNEKETLIQHSDLLNAIVSFSDLSNIWLNEERIQQQQPALEEYLNSSIRSK